MRRAHFLALTGLSVDQHRGMVRKGLLPFLEAEDGWSDYTLRQVFYTAIAIALADLTISQSEAAARAVELPRSADQAMRAIFDEPVDPIWGASFRNPAKNHRPDWVVGDRATIMLPAELGEVLESGATSVALLDLVAIARQIRQRGLAAGLNTDLVGGL